jgi:hypothetical protein
MLLHIQFFCKDPRFGGSFPPPPSNEHYRSTQRDMDSLMSIRDFPAIQSRHQGAYPQVQFRGILCFKNLFVHFFFSRTVT